MNIFELFKSLRTNAILLSTVVLALNSAGIDISADQLGQDLDKILAAVVSAVGVAGIVRDYFRRVKAKKENGEKK